VVPLVLAGLGAIWIAPHAVDHAKVRVRQAPFRLARVEIQGLDRVPAAELREALAPAHDVPLVDLDVAALEARLEAHPWIARATILRWPPDALRVRVEERRPLAVTPAGDDATLYGVDASGRAFAPAGAEDVKRLVAVALASPPVVGEPDPRLAEALALAAGLRERGLEVPRRVTLGLPDREASAEIRLRGFAPAIFIEREGAARQLDRLATLLASNVPAVPTARVIDLRFDGRAVLWGGP
jgi:cell division protein FtsQ